MKRVVVMQDGFIYRDVLTDKPSVTVGRNPENDIQIDNKVVSGVHLRLTLSPELLVEDLGSTNGTLVNGVKIDKPTPFNFGKMISIVRYQIYVLDEKKQQEKGGSGESTWKVDSPPSS